MRYVGFKYEQFTNVNKTKYTPLFDVILDRPEEAAELLWCHVDEKKLQEEFQLNLSIRNLRDKGFDDDGAYSRELYHIIDYVVIEYDFEFVSSISQLMDEPHYGYWMQIAEKMARELKLKNVLND